MEKSRNSQHETPLKSQPDQSSDMISGVFERADAIFAEPIHDKPQKSVGRILKSFDLPQDETETLVNETIAKLNELDKQATAIRQEAEKSLLEKVRGWANNNKFAATLLLAGAIHSPVIARSSGFIEKIEQAIKTVKAWERNGAFVMPQSAEQAKKATEQIYERGKRVDQEKRSAYMDDLRSKMESGEEVKLNETYLKLEEVNGENPKRVESAEKNKQEMIEKFAKQMGDDFTEDFIKNVVNEMFGSNENYQWGQGSVTEYFNTGKRNCLSIARAEQMVFEALIDRLPEEKKSKYELGNAFEKQHEIAILKVLNPDGTIEKTYFLQPPVNTLVGTADRPGSPTVSLKTIQSSIVAKKPIAISSNAKPGEIPPSPDLITVSNQPVSTNIDIQGDLKGSDYIERIVEERNIEIQWKEPSTEDQIMDLEIIKKDPVAQTKNVIERINTILKTEAPKDGSGLFIDVDLSKLDWKNVTPEQLDKMSRVLALTDWEKEPDAIVYGNLNDLPQELVVNLPYKLWREVIVEIKPDVDGKIDLKKFYMMMEACRKRKAIIPPKVRFVISADASNIKKDIFAGLAPGNFVVEQRDEQAIKLLRFTEEEVEAIVNSEAEHLYLSGNLFHPAGLQRLIDNPNKTYHLGLGVYTHAIAGNPDILKYKHIIPWIDRIFSDAEVNTLRTCVSDDVYKKIEPSLFQLNEKSIEKYGFGKISEFAKSAPKG